MRISRLVLQAAVAFVLSTYALLTPTVATADTDLQSNSGQCAWCWTLNQCPSDAAIQELCASRGCGPYPTCGQFGGCTGDQYVIGCLGEPE